MAIRLVLADDHPAILEGLQNLFGREPDFEVVAQCLDGEEALKAVRTHRPDVLILDIRMPGKDGLAVVREMDHEKLPTSVVMMTAGLDEDEVIEAVRLGVSGVVLKEMALRLLVQCVRKVHVGEQWLEKRSAGRALEKLLRQEAGARQAASVLTPREIEIVRLVASGLRNHEVAEKLFISEGTVKNHLGNIYEKLQISGRIELVRYAQEKGLLG